MLKKIGITSGEVIEEMVVTPDNVQPYSRECNQIPSIFSQNKYCSCWKTSTLLDPSSSYDDDDKTQYKKSYTSSTADNDDDDDDASNQAFLFFSSIHDSCIILCIVTTWMLVWVLKQKPPAVRS